MNVLFVNPPHTGFDRNQSPQLTFSIARIPPFGAITMAAYLRQYGHRVAVIDGYRISLQCGNVRSETYREIVRIAKAFSPDLVAVTMLTADIPECIETVRLLKKHLPAAIIVGGGPHPSGEPAGTLQQIPELDGIGVGPGEDICLELANGSRIADTPGCAYLRQDKVLFVEKRTIDRDIDRIPFPAWDLIDADFYSELNKATTFNYLSRSMGVLSSRGCPGQCYFCSSAWNRPLRAHSAGYILDYCDFLIHAFHIDTIVFWDDTLALSAKRLVEICEGFINRGVNKKIQWRACLRADQTNPDVLKLMKRAGCFFIAVGIESGNDNVLNRLHKGTTVETNRTAVSRIKEAGLGLGVSVILGSPGETESEMMDTIRFCETTNADSMGAGRFCPLPGSPAYGDLVKAGRIDPQTADWEVLGNFSRIDGPCYAAVSPKRFTTLLRRLFGYCNDHNQASFEMRYAKTCPEIARLYQRAPKRSSLAKSLLRNVTPPFALRLMANVIHLLRSQCSRLRLRSRTTTTVD